MHCYLSELTIQIIFSRSLKCFYESRPGFVLFWWFFLKFLKLEVGLGKFGISFPLGKKIYDMLREELGLSGFANSYLTRWWYKSKLINTADLAMYKQLMKIDAEFGTTQTEQLHALVNENPSMEFIKVWIKFRAFVIYFL